MLPPAEKWEEAQTAEKTVKQTFFSRNGVFKHSFLFKKLNRGTITHLLLLPVSRACKAPSRLSGEGTLTGGFEIPCVAQTHVELLSGSSRSCCGCYLLICVAAGAGLHLKMWKFRPWWLQRSDGMRFWKEAQLVSPSSRSSFMESWDGLG